MFFSDKRHCIISFWNNDNGHPNKVTIILVLVLLSFVIIVKHDANSCSHVCHDDQALTLHSYDERHGRAMHVFEIYASCAYLDAFKCFANGIPYNTGIIILIIAITFYLSPQKLERKKFKIDSHAPVPRAATNTTTQIRPPLGRDLILPQNNGNCESVFSNRKDKTETNTATMDKATNFDAFIVLSLLFTKKDTIAVNNIRFAQCIVAARRSPQPPRYCKREREKKGYVFALKNGSIGIFLVDLIDKIFNLFITTIVIEFNWFVFDCGWHTLLVLLLLFLGLYMFVKTSCGVPATRQAGDESTRRGRKSAWDGGLERGVCKEERPIQNEFDEVFGVMYVFLFVVFDIIFGFFFCFEIATELLFCAGARINNCDDCYYPFVSVVCVFHSVCSIVVGVFGVFGVNMNEWILFIFIKIGDYCQFIFGNVIDNGGKFAVHFSLAMSVLIIVFLFLLFCNNSTIRIISTTTTTIAAYSLVFYFVTSSTFISNYFSHQCARLRKVSRSGHALLHFFITCTIGFTNERCTNTFSNRKLIFNKTTTSVTAKNNKNELNEGEARLVNYLFIILTFTTIMFLYLTGKSCEYVTRRHTSDNSKAEHLLQPRHRQLAPKLGGGQQQSLTNQNSSMKKADHMQSS